MRVYSVAISTDQPGSGQYTFGVYQPSSPHPVPQTFVKSNHPDFGELVATGSVNGSGHLLINSGPGRLVFEKVNDQFVISDPPTVIDPASECVLATQASSALLTLFESENPQETRNPE